MKIERATSSLNLPLGGCRNVLKMACFYMAIVMPLTTHVFAQVQNRKDICVRIDKVGEAPGVWSGILGSTQWLDATIIASSTTDYRVGSNISIGLYVVQGDKFADSQTPRLNPKIIYTGAILTIDTKASCRADGGKGWVYTCIKKGCSKRASGTHETTGRADPPKQQ